MNICVFGLWHLGSVTSACLARLSHRVIGLDFNEEIINSLQKTKAPLFEPGLDEMIREGVRSGKLSFTRNAAKALEKAEVLWVTFDTPVSDKDVADISFLEDNIKKIMPYFKVGLRIVISSQAPVGFVSRIEGIFTKRYPRKKCYFACSPENLKLGKAIEAFLNPDRIIIGVRDKESKAAFNSLFSSISKHLEWMKIESAEMTKHAINSFLAVSVSFANEIASICEKSGADAREVARGLKTESRIGPKAYLRPGTAFSGGTLARDINFLIRLSNKFKLPSYLIKVVNSSNSFHKKWTERKCRQVLKDFRRKKIAILGLAYKSGIDTLRRSPALELARSLHTKGAEVRGFDPIIKSITRNVSKVIELKKSVDEAIIDAEVVIISADCPEFLDFGSGIMNLMRKKFIIDPNGFIADLFDSTEFNYICVGRDYKEGGKV